ncbi:MAG: ABC transporter ATP-binding protein [Bacteriovoracaceae bacterium]|jgi:ABC-type Fe3+/spermidine/putrescine transport system ATPase subunit|nr:ABC transporter ATP-binding protein [Bacteriovoracaceae bacterium]
MKAIQLKDMTLRYDQRKTDGVTQVSFDVYKGEVFSLLGPSGSGKSTTLKCIAGLLMPASGSLEVQKDEKIIYMDQTPKFSLNKTVYENLEDEIINSESHAEKRANMIRTLLSQLGLTNEIDSLASSLSGGQLQRMIMAKALIQGPSILLLDEPFANLDNILRRELIEELFILFKEKDMTVMWVTHDLDEALAYSHRIALLNYGQLQQIDSPQEIYLRPKNLFTAQFFSQVNLITAKVTKRNDSFIFLEVFEKELRFPLNQIRNIDKIKTEVLLVIHPEHIFLSEDKNESFQGSLTRELFHGAFTLIEFKCNNHFLWAKVLSWKKPNKKSFYFNLDSQFIHLIEEV